MENVLVRVVEGDAGAKLQDAARVGGDDGLSASGLCVAHFFSKQFH